MILGCFVGSASSQRRFTALYHVLRALNERVERRDRVL